MYVDCEMWRNVILALSVILHTIKYFVMLQIQLINKTQTNVIHKLKSYHCRSLAMSMCSSSPHIHRQSLQWLFLFLFLSTPQTHLCLCFFFRCVCRSTLKQSRSSTQKIFFSTVSVLFVFLLRCFIPFTWILTTGPNVKIPCGCEDWYDNNGIIPQTTHNGEFTKRHIHVDGCFDEYDGCGSHFGSQRQSTGQLEGTECGREAMPAPFTQSSDSIYFEEFYIL